MNHLQEKLPTYNKLLDARLRHILEDSSGLAGLYHMMAYHLGCRDEQFEPSNRGQGKRLRPTLCFLVCESVGGETESAVEAALAVELIHNFSLVHDDIEDGSMVRRHRAAVWALWGISHGVNIGDGLFALAHLALTEDRLNPDTVCRGVRVLSRTCVELCEGQFLDLELGGRSSFDVGEYLTLIRKKTSALFGCAAELGALSGGASSGVTAQLVEFARILGEAFQMQDDILGVWGARAVTGKVAEDVRERKRGLPAAITWQLVAGEELERLSGLYARSDLLRDNEVHWVLDLFQRLGVRQRAMLMVQEKFAHADKLLDEALPDREITEPLRQLVDEIAGRAA